MTRKSLLEPSKLGHILSANPALLNYQTSEGEFIKYKGRSYCWVSISRTGIIQLNQNIIDFLNLEIGMELLSIRSSDIAFTMGAKGPLLEKAENYDGEIKIYYKQVSRNIRYYSNKCKGAIEESPFVQIKIDFFISLF